MTPIARVPCSNTANIRENNTWMQSEFCTWFAPGKILLRGKSPRKCIYNVTSQKTATHCAKFGWPLLSDIGAVVKPKCNIHWSLLGYPKLTNLSQLLVGQISPYCEDMWRRYCCLTSLFPIVNIYLSCEDIAWQSCVMVRRWRIFASCIFSKPRAAYFRPAF